MAEIGIVASIIGVAGAGFRLSLILNAISCEVANAPLEIHQISKTVTLFSLMLKQVGVVLKAADSVHSHEAVEAAEQVSNDCTRVFDEITEMLDRCRRKGPEGTFTPSIQQRFKWCFKKGRITYLLAQLESLKLSLSLMLQILSLGKLMAATSKNDSPEEVEIKTAEIKQERAEAQNIVIIRYMQNEQVEKLYQACEFNNEPQSPLELPSSPSSDSSILTIEPPPEYSSSMALVRLPLHSLGEVDQMLSQIRNSSKDMVRVSDQVIDPLLEKWTRWHEIREQRHAQQANGIGRYIPKVDSLYDDDEDVPLSQRFPAREDSPRGYYLEGTTTDWRRPHSVAARQEAARRKKRYTGYQPTVSADGSDVDHSQGSGTSSKPRTKRHVINSSSDSSDSEQEKQHRRKDSGISYKENKPPLQPAANIDRSIPRGLDTGSRQGSVPTHMYPGNGNRASLSPQYMPPSQYRPYPTPDQHALHHSMSTPLPPIYTHNAAQQATASPSSPSYMSPPYYNNISQQTSRNNPQYSPNQSRGPPQSRPRSGEGNGGRSPSRLSYENPPSRFSRSRERQHSGEGKKNSKESRAKNLTNGAAKGLLGGTAIAGFLEALEGLSL